MRADSEEDEMTRQLSRLNAVINQWRERGGVASTLVRSDDVVPDWQGLTMRFFSAQLQLNNSSTRATLRYEMEYLQWVRLGKPAKHSLKLS